MTRHEPRTWGVSITASEAEKKNEGNSLEAEVKDLEREFPSRQRESERT